MSQSKDIILFAGSLATIVAVFRFDQAAFLMLVGAMQACFGTVFIIRRRVPVVGGAAEFKSPLTGLPAILLGVALLIGGAWLVAHSAFNLSDETLARLHWRL